MVDHDELLKQKKRLFDALGSSSDDEVLDTGRIEAQSVLKKLKVNKAAAAGPGGRPLARSISDSRLSAEDKAARVTADPPSSTDPQSLAKHNKGQIMPRAPSTLRKTVSDVVKPKDRASGTSKRKRIEPYVPVEKQLFKGLQFYFFPNDDKNPARKKRIKKAEEYGAVWQRSWGLDVTHVIVDKGLTYQQLLKYLKVSELPTSTAVVSENYAASCIGYGTLLDHKQPLFAVQGVDTVKNAPVESVESDTSLKLKPPGKGVLGKKPETPPQDQPRNLQVTATIQSAMPGVRADGGLDAERIPNSFRALETNDELDAAIAEARALEDVPLDDEDDARPSTADSLDSEDEKRRPGLQPANQRKSKYKSMEDKFQCMQKHTGKESGAANAATIDILQQMADYYGQIGDEWRIRAYRKAISSLRNHPNKIATKEEALALPNVGDRLATKIEEIALTKRLKRLDNAKAEPVDQLVQTFMQVYGAGIVQANRWVNDGYTSLDELYQNADLTDNQRIGIEHYEDFNSRIPRAEVAQHGAIVREAIQQVDPAFEVIVGGSYRRGSKDSGDIDCLITRPGSNADHLRNVVLGQLIPQLSAQGFLVASLATTSKDDGSKWHGASCLPGSKVWRRIDLLLVPSDELGAALIYWTGNDIFNRSLRLLASTKGMRLNQRGLFKEVMRGAKRVKLTEGTLVEGKDEKKIFEALGVPWRPPEHRIC